MEEVSSADEVFGYMWEDMGAIVLGMSREDELVEGSRLRSKHKLDVLMQDDERQFRLVELSGSHDACRAEKQLPRYK